ncbi:deoxyribose-phosphate aldolase [soil metagenome]
MSTEVETPTTSPLFAPRSLSGVSLRVTPVDAVGLEARAASFTTRSIKSTSKRAAIHLAISCIDLTTLEGMDTPGKVAGLCRKAVRPDPTNAAIPSVAAVCVYPQMVPVAVQQTVGSSVAVASVAGAFPSGQSSLAVRTADIEHAVADGANEIDIVISRGAFLSGDYHYVFNEIEVQKAACGPAHLKVILETGELGSYDQIRKASMLAMAAGADFIKTSTGKVANNSSLPVALCMAEAIRDYAEQTGEVVGLKVAGGIRTAKQAWHYLVLIGETLGVEWLTPDLFRIGASSLLNDLLLQLQKLDTGRYSGPNYVSVD